MSGIGVYLLRIICAGLICSIIKQLLGDKGAVGGVVKFLAGVFMTLVVISPALDIRLDDYADEIADFESAGIYAASEGQADAKETMAEIISERTQAYILDKAKSLGAEVSVCIQLTDDMPPIPKGTEIIGNISPYAKNALSQYIENELGISKEEQVWIG